MNDGLIELSGRKYMHTARVYEEVKKDVDYTPEMSSFGMYVQKK